ncbi:MAG: VOC family protein [Myxococcota bacterium]
MKIWVMSVFVDDQAKALDFYTTLLGFEKKEDIPLGAHRWLSVVSPESRDGVELLLEPSEHPAVPPYKEALVADGIPSVSFQVNDLAADHERLAAAGVEFVQAPMDAGTTRIAVFNDTCGNLVQLVERLD